MRYFAFCLAALSLPAFCRAQAQAGGGAALARPVAPTAAPVIAQLPNSLHERNSALIAQRREMTMELTKVAEAAAAELRQEFPSWAFLSNESERAAKGPRAGELVRNLAQTDMERFVFGGGRSVVLGKPGEGYTFLENSQWFAAILAALGDETNSNTLATFAMVKPEVVETAADYLKADTAGKRKIIEGVQAALEADPKDDALVQTAILLIRRNLNSTDLSDSLAGLYGVMKASAKLMPTSGKMFVAMTEARSKALNVADGVGTEPMTIAGTLVNDKPFTTADWKGKVILVDFWATWCGPCKAELPRIKEIYKQYHAQGLEILGVSNDYAAKDLEDYLATDKDLSWPQLFDKTAAADMKWHPVTSGFGINGIPQMYLIDRKGILRSVNARSEMETLIPKLLAEAGDSSAATN